jgi:hypothetical protein
MPGALPANRFKRALASGTQQIGLAQFRKPDGDRDLRRRRL